MSQPKQTPDENMAHSGGGPPGYLAPAVALVSCISTSAFNRAKLALEKEPSSPTEIDAGQNTSTAIATNGASPSGISNGVSPSPVTSSESKFVVSGPHANANQPEQHNGNAMNGVSLPIGSKLYVIGPLANVHNQPEQLNALNGVHVDVAKKMKDILNNRKPYQKVYYEDFVSVLTSEPYGGIRNIYRCSKNMTAFASDIYFDLWYNQSRISEVNFVACESGAYLAVKLMQFIDLYGDSFVNSVTNFNIIWRKFLNEEPINLPSQPGSKISKICHTIILIDPSLSAPCCLAKWLAYRSVMYDHLKLVAPKGDSGERLCLVLHTGLVTATHLEVEVKGAESFSDDGVTALVEHFKNFINA